MSLPTTPSAWASRLTAILRVTIPPEHRFPVDVAEAAKEISAQIYPTDPIRVVEGRDLAFADGALMPIGTPRRGWGVAYDEGIRSPGRRRFTIAHEVGHYFVHRNQLPEGRLCSSDDILNGKPAIEREADTFAAAFLMPLDDFRSQISARSKPDFTALSACAERYGVSLIAAILRWLTYTERRAVLVVARDGFLLWARSSEPALRTRAFIRTSREPVEVPGGALAASLGTHSAARDGEDLPAGVWFPEPVREMCVVSDQYELTMSLLLLEDADPKWGSANDVDDEDTVARPVDRFIER